MPTGKRARPPESYAVVYLDSYTWEKCWTTRNPLFVMTDKSSRFGSRLVKIGEEAFKNESYARQKAMENAAAGQHVELR